jgi:protein-S-isoprenylcysteine O-methyltransferase Ste14
VNWSRIARRVRVPLGFLLAAVYICLARPTRWSIMVGLAVSAIGLAIRAAASGYVRKNEELATTGPYAHTRNPLYLGSIVIAVGFALAARSWLMAAILLLMFLAVYLPVIRSEEEFLRRHFPEFAEYESRVPRLWPRPSSALKADSGESFSLSLYRQHREYNALAGTLAMAAMLVAKLWWLSR